MNEPPVIDNLVDEAAVQSRNKIEKSLSDRILGYAFVGSVVINIVWVVLVSNSNLFGKGGAVNVLHDQRLKVFKPIPVKPKPKPVKPPPPPPKPKLEKPKPILHPRITPPQPTRHQVSVHTTKNTHSVNQLSVPPAPPAPPAPFTPTPPGVPPTPPAPPAPPTPPAPPAPPPNPPAPPAPPPPPPPPPPRLPPPPPPRPKNYSPIAVQEASAPSPDDLGVSTDGIDGSTITNSSIVISFTIDETGHVRGAHVTESSGNPDLDRRYRDAIERARCTPAIQDHIPRDARRTITIPVSAG